MREELAKYENWRGEFTAVFKRFGTRRAFKGPPVKTLLFVEVKDGAGAEMCDHVWFNDCAGWQRHELKPGDRVAFNARIVRYVKGYKGRRQDDDLPAPSTDFRLSHPTHSRLLNRAGTTASDPAQLPLFHDSRS